MQEKNWLERNRGVIMGLAVAVLVLNIMLFLIVPAQTTVSLQGSFPCYRAEGVFREDVALTLSGVIQKAPFSDAVFTGSICVSGMDGLEEPAAFTLTRQDGRWAGAMEQTGPCCLLCVAAGKDFSDPVIVLSPSSPADGTLCYDFTAAEPVYLAPEAVSARAAAVQWNNYFQG